MSTIVSCVFCSVSLVVVVVNVVAEDVVVLPDIVDVDDRGSAMETVVIATLVPVTGVVLIQVESVGVVILLVERSRSGTLVVVDDVLVFTLPDTEERLAEVVVESGRNVDVVVVVGSADVTSDVIDDVNNDKLVLRVLRLLTGDDDVLLVLLDLSGTTDVDLGNLDELYEL